MAVVLDALAAQVLKNIKAMGEAEIRMLLGVSGEIKKLEASVEPLRSFLVDAERRRITDKRVQAWESKLKNAMYEAADILDLCQLEAMDRQEEHASSSLSWLCSLEGALREKLHDCLVPYVISWDKLKGILHPFLFCLYNPGFANEVGSRIKKLNYELANIRNSVADFNFMIDLGSYEEQRRPPTSSASYPRRENTQFVQSDLVGDQIKKNTQKLVHKLIDGGHHEHGSSAVRVVAIVGQGGIGKSTLAKKVFANEAIKEEFKMTIWLNVTQQFTNVDLLRVAISQAGGKHGENEDDETLLVEALTDALSKRKFLLVLDDVWNQEAWDNVLRVPVLNAGATQPGSRVLVTSRKDDVVRNMGASILRVNILDDEDAWCLLKKQLPQPQVGVQSDFDELNDVGMKIVKKCDGLPLAIKVMGGLLSRRDPKKHDWEIVLHKNLDWKEEYGLQEELYYSVRLSYDDLSPELKQCLLYYSLFPKGSGFTEDRVISMWISEGFVQHDERSDQLDLEQIGADYHRELVARNLLEPYDSTDNIWQYTLRDVLRSFAQFMAKEEAFVVHKDQADSRNLLPENKKFRSLSIELSDSELELTTLENQETLRTLLIGCEIKPGGSLANFASLRVLDISSKESDWLVDSLCELRHLRYLSFSNTNISRLPGDIHKMRFLEHILLVNCTKLEKLPKSITKLVCLRHLSLYGSNVDVIPRGFGGLTNLRTLHGFPVKMDGGWCTLEELEALSHLRSLTVQSLENVPGSSVAKKAKISNKKSLEYLELNCYKDEEAGKEVRQIGLDQQQRIEAVFDELCPPPRLRTLIIKRYFGRQLPDWLHSPEATTFKSLKNIDLVHITYCTRLPDGLCRIHGLEKLLIKDAPAIEHVGPDFQTLARGDGGVAFPNMRILELIGLSGWKEWDWEEEEQSKVIAMPALELLKLTECKLTHLPPGLASDGRYNLRTIHLANLSLLEFVENFPSVVELKVYNCPKLKRIGGLAKLRTVNIKGCPKLKLPEGVPVLNRMELHDGPWEATESDARCTPKGYQARLPCELPQNLTHVSNNLESILQNQSSRPHAVPLKHLEEITNNFSEERILGRGGFGVVYKGVLQNGEMIAVKKIVSSLMPGEQKQFENEVYHLMKINHPNIVRFVGYCYEIKKECLEYNGKYIFAEMEEKLLCLEYLPRGSLDKYISDESSGLDWSTCYNIIEGICCGLLDLHVQNDKPIIHLDLKPANILLGDGMVPKIADFGLSRLLDQQQTICTASPVGTLGYMAREYVDGGKITPKSDIFSLGVIIIEVVTGHRDYPDIITKMSSDEFINLALEKWRNVLQRSPGYVSLEMDCEQIKRCLQVGLICVNPDRTKRPLITKVISMLQGSESIDCDISDEATA